MPEFRLQATPLDGDALKEELRASSCGACVTFEGWVRDHNEGRVVEALHYEAYALVALSEGNRILEEATARFAVERALCVHRLGDLSLGDMAVWVGVSAAHRGPAFEACRYVIDEIKARVPIWKKERYTDGAPAWVNHAPDNGDTAPQA